MTEEWIKNRLAHVAAWILRKDWNTHVALIIYPIKYYYNDEGCFMKRIGARLKKSKKINLIIKDVTEDRDLQEWYEYRREAN